MWHQQQWFAVCRICLHR